MKVNHTSTSSLRLLPLGAFLLFFPLAAAQAAGSAKCYLHGIITPIDSRNEKTVVSDMIRLHFDADNRSKCEAMLKSYCQYNVREKKYSPTRLKGSFKPDVEKAEEHDYTFEEKCKLLSEED